MKWIKILILAAGLVLTVPTAVLGSRKTVGSPEALRMIQYDGGSMFDNTKLTVDFTANTVSYEYEDMVKQELIRNTAAFTEEQALAFLRTANDCGLFGWSPEYYKDVSDGTRARVTVEFADGSVQEVNCSNKYPRHFDEARDALFDLARPCKTVDSLDMLRSIRYESFDNLFEDSFSLTLDFFAHTVTTERNGAEQCTASFTEAQAQSLLQTANDCNLFGWDEYYACEDVEDGTWAALTVEFADGTVQDVFCSNKYPPDFERLENALRDLGDLHS